METETLGFVGLGDMGAPMAANLSRGGFRLIVFDTCESCFSKYSARLNGVR